MKVLITDDERHVQEAVTMLVDWQKYGVSDLLYANNGQEALELLQREKPAIMFCDMRMPVMDGVALMQCIQELEIETLVIAISGYDDFKYARAAILANGVDYILKPFDKEMLESAMDSAVKRLEGITESFSHKRRAQVSAVQLAGERINEWMRSGSSTALQIKEDLQAIGCKAGKKVFLTAFLPRNGESVREDLMDGDRQLFLFVIRNVISEIMRQYGCNFFHFGDGYVWYLISQPKYGVLGEHVSRLEYLKYKLFEIFGLEFTYVFQDEAVLQEQLPVYFEMLKKQFLDEKLTQQEREGTEAIPGFAQVRPLLEQAIKRREQKAVIEIIERFVKRMENQALTVGELQVCTAEVNLFLKKRNPGARAMSLWISSLNDWKVQVENELCELFQQAEEERFDAASIYRYLQTHYQEDITLAGLSRQFGYSAQHIARLYRKAYDTTVVTALKGIRITHARELLEHTEMTVTEVAQAVGYEDENYFGKVFKSETGTSPKQYRHRR